jgi:type I restriction enzyme, S subunit
MKKYADYAFSQASWLGFLPEHWDCKKIGALFSERKTKVSDKEYAPLSVAKAGVVPQLANAAKTNAGDNRKLVCSGDFVINSRSDRKGSCGVSELEGSVSLINIVLTPRRALNSRYVHYLLRSHNFSEEYYRNGRGIVADLWATRYSEMKSIFLPVPPREEQDQIVRFLDWKVSSINSLIAIKKQKVSNYVELRKAIIDQGILHGFTNEQQVDSGVYWLGKIPVSWEVLPLKRICKVNASISDTVRKMSDDDIVTFLPMENVTETGKIDCSIKKRVADVRSGFSSFAKGDVVVAKITPCFENGKGACMDALDTEIGFGTTEFINLRPSMNVLSKYLYMITMTRPFRKLGEKVMTGSAGQKRISAEYIKNFTLGIPPIDEQYLILDEIELKLKKLDKLIETDKQNIKCLHELKSRIIFNTVTGKIDVRGIEVPDFEYVEETEDISESEELDEESAEEEV